ncbi:MAG: chromosomal replication initiator protein DnaA, partial [Pseudomonadota bacterium]
MSESGGKKATVVSLYGQVLAPETFDPTPEIKVLWDKIYNKMREEFGEAVFRSWLKPLTLQAAYHGTLEVSVPTRFMKDWISGHYVTRIQEMCAAENADIKRIEIVVVHGHVEEAPVSPAIKSPTKANVNDLAEKMELSSPLDPRFKFDTFVVGKSNALAHAAASRVVECNVPFNPLFIYGGVGLGKTHLMHAIAWEMKVKRPEKTVMYLSAEKFMYQFVRAIRAQDTMTFKEIFRSVDVLMIDDIQFIAGKDSTQEEFFHTFNALVDQNKQIIISADRPPSELQGIDERLRSRMSWGLVADIHPTTYDLRLGILKSRCTQLEAHVPENVLEFLALKITS